MLRLDLLEQTPSQTKIYDRSSVGFDLSLRFDGSDAEGLRDVTVKTDRMRTLGGVATGSASRSFLVIAEEVAR